METPRCRQREDEEGSVREEEEAEEMDQSVCGSDPIAPLLSWVRGSILVRSSAR